MQNYNKGMSFSLFIGKNRIHLTEIDSTNNYALEWMKGKRPPEGSLVTAEIQYQGRGQRGNTWLSKAGLNLTASYILYPVFLSAQGQFWLNKALSLAVADTIQNILSSEQVQIKWPNDILVRKKKIAGILIENQLQGTSLSACVFGIGLNVNQTDFSQLPLATSLANITGCTYSIQNVIEELSSQVEKRYLQLKAANYQLLQKNYSERLFGLQEGLSLELDNKVHLVKVEEVNALGQLVVEIDGHLRTFSHGEVKIILD